MLPKKYRLPAKEFRNLYQRGIKVRGKFGMLILDDRNVSFPQFGFVVNKKIGNAVMRHRMTRLLRDIVREFVPLLHLENSKKVFQYIAFEFCTERELLRTEMLEQFKKVLKNV